MAMRIRPGDTDKQITYVTGRFAQDNAFIVNQIGGHSPFGGILTSMGSDYFVEITPDGSGRSWFDGRPITSPNGTGKAWYIRDQETGQMWSAFHGPVCGKTDEYEVSFTPGSATAHSLMNKIACDVTVATSPDHACELWRVKLQNRSASDRVITFTSYVRPRAGSSLESKYLPKEKTVVMRRPLDALDSERSGRAVQDLVFFQSCTLAPTRYEIDKARFIGEGRSLQNPAFVEVTRQEEIDPVTESAVISFSIELELPIEGEAEFGFCFGAARSVEDALLVVRKHTSLQDIDTAVNATSSQWKELNSTLQVKSHDRSFDALMNTWLPYEACAEWIKEHAGTPHLDPYRAADALRCLTPFYATSSDLCRETLLNFAARLSVLGSYSEDGGSQVTLPPNELLWLALCTARYVAETGDETVLSRGVSLTDGPCLTLAEHCERAIRMCLYEKEAVTDYADLVLLEQALKLWSLLGDNSGEFGSQIQAVEKRRAASRPEHSEDRNLPRRTDYLQSVCPSLGSPEVTEVLIGCVGQPERSSKESGASCLAYSAIAEHVLGIEATSEGLMLDPHLPETWSECTVTRRFRGDVYNIHIKRSASKSKQSESIVVDNEPVFGKMLPFFNDGKEHNIDVTVV